MRQCSFEECCTHFGTGSLGRQPASASGTRLTPQRNSDSSTHEPSQIASLLRIRIAQGSLDCQCAGGCDEWRRNIAALRKQIVAINLRMRRSGRRLSTNGHVMEIIRWHSASHLMATQWAPTQSRPTVCRAQRQRGQHARRCWPMFSLTRVDENALDDLSLKSAIRESVCLSESGMMDPHSATPSPFDFGMQPLRYRKVAIGTV